MNKLRSFSLSFYLMCSRPLTIFVTIGWTYSSLSTSSLYWAAQKWTQDSSYSLAIAEQLNLLDTSLSMQPSMCSALTTSKSCCWSISNLSISTLKSFSAEPLTIHMDSSPLLSKTTFNFWHALAISQNQHAICNSRAVSTANEQKRKQVVCGCLNLLATDNLGHI